MTSTQFPLERDKHIRRSGDDYAYAFMNLLPQGQAWPKEPGSTLERSVNGLSQYWGTVDARAADLLERESDPRTTIELLPDWERAWGLPDPCMKTPQTISERQRALVQRITLLGAQSRAWFIDVATWSGQHITIDEFSPWICGISRCGSTADEDAVFVNDVQMLSLKQENKDGEPVEILGGSFKLNFAGKTTEDIPFDADAETVEAALAVLPAIGLDNVTCDGGPLPNGTIRIEFVNNLRYMRQPLITVYLNELFGPTETIIDDEGNEQTIGTKAGPPVIEHTAYGSGYHNRWEIAHPEIRFYWRVHVDTAKLIWFRCGSGECGVDPHLIIGLAEDLECLFLRWKPAQTQIVYDYSGLSIGGPMAGTP